MTADAEKSRRRRRMMDWEGSNDDIVGWFEAVAEDAAGVQTETLRRIIELNIGTEYLQKWLGRGSDVDVRDMNPAELESLYAAAVPLASHANLEPYIRRIADGDTSPLLTQKPITMLSLSSGTTDGRPKYVPFTDFSSCSTLQIFRLASAYRSRALPLRPGGRILEFIYSSKQFRTKGGLIAGTATTHYFESQEFKTKQKVTNCFTCSPYEVISAGDYKQSTYCHLLLGLVLSEEVEFVTSTFAYSIFQALAALEELWEELCEDIRRGTLSSRVTIPAMRKAVMDQLKASGRVAERMERECRELERSGWRCVVQTLWPNAKYVYSIMTGSMEPYLRKLRHYAGEVPLVCADYGSTESWIGVNLSPLDPPERVAFTVVPTLAYFEFIPLFSGRRQKHHLLHLQEEEMESSSVVSDDYLEGQPLPLSKLCLGQQYEVVLTTFTGLYRYRLGDVVEVVGFYKGTPNLSFVCRRKLILTVNIDKNTEKDLQMVVEKAASVLAKRTAAGAELVDFTSHAEVTEQPGHYVIYWEIEGAAADEVLEECCRELDAGFIDHGYVVSRRSGSIGPLELRVVERGTFGKILEHYIANGAAMSQYKTPRCTTNQALLCILDCSTVKRFRSSGSA